MDLPEYLDEKGLSPFENGLNLVNVQSAEKVLTALEILECCNSSIAKKVEGGVYELKIDFDSGIEIRKQI
jgi:putative component of toxin-antitoxin plasmid stabilization module